jgi:hypothetical protein
MSGTTKTVLVVAGVGIGAYVLLELLQGSKPGAPTGGSANSNYALFAGLVNIGGAIANAVAAQPQSAPTPTPTYVIGKGYVSGGANAPIDPTTGGVILPAGQVYGP